MKYRCGNKTFASLEAACSYANSVFSKTGVILGIEAA